VSGVHYQLAGQCREVVSKARAKISMVKAKARARAQRTREGDKDRLRDTCRLTTGEGSGRFMTSMLTITCVDFGTSSRNCRLGVVRLIFCLQPHR
jgi:hypothetical protein